MSKTADIFRRFWERFGSSMTKSSISVDGIKRPMTEEEEKHFGAAFTDAHRAFEHAGKAFDAARRENRRRAQRGRHSR